MTQDAIDAAAGTVVDTVEETHPALRSMLQMQSLEAGLAEDTVSDDFVMDLMEQILTADSVEEIFAAQETGMVAGKDFAARPFYLRSEDISIRRSTIDGNGLPFYAVFRAREIATGEESIVNCGGKTFLAVLHALRQKDYFEPSDEYPLGKPMVIQAKPSPAGAYLLLSPFKMMPAPAPAAKTQKSGKK